MSKAKINLKTCTECKIEYPLTEFYKTKRADQKKIKVSATCKLCCCAYSRENRAYKKEYYSEHQRKYRATPEAKAVRRAYLQNPKTREAIRELYRFNRTDPEFMEKKRAAERRRYYLIKADPVKLAERKAKRKVWRKLRNERKRNAVIQEQA